MSHSISLRRSSLALCFLLLGSATQLVAQRAAEPFQWRQIGHGLSAPTVRMFAFNALGDLFAATESGIIKVDSASLSARAVLTNASRTVFTFPDGVMISLGDGVFRSDDDGESWDEVSRIQVDRKISVGIDGKLYRARGLDLLRSDDTGSTWRTIMAAQYVNASDVFVLSKGDLLTYASQALRSTDDGDSWTPIDMPSLNAMIETRTGALVGTRFGQVMRSEDRGNSWSPGDSLDFVRITSDDAGILYAIEESMYSLNRRGTYRSIDDGRSWQRIGMMSMDEIAVQIQGSIWWSRGSKLYHMSGIYSNSEAVQFAPLMYKGMIADVAVDPAGTLYVATPSFVTTGWSESIVQHALSRSTDDGASWLPLAESLGDRVVAPFNGVVLAARKTLYTYPMRSDRISESLIGSTDGGLTWRSILGSPRDISWTSNGTIAIASLAVADFEGATYASPMAISLDSGVTWTTPTFQAPWSSVVATRSGAIVASTFGFGGTRMYEGRTLRSTDAGITWSSVADSLVLNEIAEIDTGVLLAVGFNWHLSEYLVPTMTSSGIYRSTNDGISWDLVLDHAGASTTYTKSAFAKSRVTLCAIGDQLLRSTDNGATWLDVEQTLSTDRQMVRVDSGGGFVVATRGGILRSSDDALSWQVVSSKMPDSVFTAVAVAPQGYLIAGTTGAGLWRTDGPASTDSREHSWRPAVRITQHPIDATSRISLQLDRTSRVRATLHDMSGREVQSIVDRTMDAGVHLLPLDSPPLPAGAYLLRVTCNDDVWSSIVIIE